MQKEAQQQQNGSISRKPNSTQIPIKFLSLRQYICLSTTQQKQLQNKNTENIRRTNIHIAKSYHIES